MSKEIISENNNFEVELVSLGYRSKRLKSLKIDGKTGAITLTGAVTINGAPLTGTSAIVGTLQLTGTSAGMLLTAITAPSTPASGIGEIYIDSTSKNLSVKDDAGVVKHGVQTKTAVTNKVLTAISDAGVVTQAFLPSGAFVVTCQAGKNLAGSLTLAGVNVGDKVIGVANLTTPGDGKASFETTITVDGHIQQSLNTDQSAVIYQFMVLKQS